MMIFQLKKQTWRFLTNKKDNKIVGFDFQNGNKFLLKP